MQQASAGRSKSSPQQRPCPRRFYSSRTFKQLIRVPKATQELAAQLYVETGTTSQQITLSSCRYGMLGSAAAAAGVATEAWVAGADSAEVARQLLAAGPAGLAA